MTIYNGDLAEIHSPQGPYVYVASRESLHSTPILVIYQENE